MKIYVAAASAEIERAERMISILRARGHEITVDWPAAMRRVGKANTGLTAIEARFLADEDYRGVATAQRVVILVPRAPAASQGAWWEGGVADALEIPIIASGRPEDRARNIFLSRTIGVDTDEEVLQYLADEDGLLMRLTEQRSELATLREKVARLESGIVDLMTRLCDQDPTEKEREGMLAAIEQRTRTQR